MAAGKKQRGAANKGTRNFLAVGAKFKKGTFFGKKTLQILSEGIIAKICIKTLLKTKKLINTGLHVLPTALHLFNLQIFLIYSKS